MIWFGIDPGEHPFALFSLSHRIVLLISILGSVLIFAARHLLRAFSNRLIETAIALSLVFSEGAYHYWMYKNGIWRFSDSLPLELCSISLFGTIALLFFQKRWIDDLVFFTSLLGATQAIVTPLLDFDFPHFRFLHFFYTHLMMVWVALYFTWVKGYRPTLRSVGRVLLFLNILAPILWGINRVTGGNYMFLREKPPIPSLLDWLGPYPWYIGSLELLLVSLSFLLWYLFREKNI